MWWTWGKNGYKAREDFLTPCLLVADYVHIAQCSHLGYLPNSLVNSLSLHQEQQHTTGVQLMLQRRSCIELLSIAR